MSSIYHRVSVRKFLDKPAEKEKTILYRKKHSLMHFKIHQGFFAQT